MLSVCAMDLLLILYPQTQRLKQRLVVCGHSHGALDLYITDIQPDGALKTTHKTLEYDSFISTVKFFYHNRKPLESKQNKKILDYKFAYFNKNEKIFSFVY